MPISLSVRDASNYVELSVRRGLRLVVVGYSRGYIIPDADRAARESSLRSLVHEQELVSSLSCGGVSISSVDPHPSRQRRLSSSWRFTCELPGSWVIPMKSLLERGN